MRKLPIFAVLAALSLSVPALAQTTMDSNYSADNEMQMKGHPGMDQRTNMHRGYGNRRHALGSMRHPTVGNIANQRVNGG